MSVTDAPLPLKLQAGHVTITPQERMPLAGLTLREGSFQEVADPLEINVAILTHGQRQVVFLSVDTLFVGDTLYRAISEVVADRLGKDDISILVAASHTHFAPSLDETKPLLGPVNTGYQDYVLSQWTAAIDRIANRTPILCNGFRFREQANHTMNRRRLDLCLNKRGVCRKTRMAPNSNGPRDEWIRGVVFKDSLGQVQLVIWNFACHPVEFPRQDHVSADFPGVVRTTIRHIFGNHVPVIFLQGFSGDVRSNLIGFPKRLRMCLSGFLNGPEFVPVSDSKFANWSKSLAAVVGNACQNHAPLPSIPLMDSLERTLPLNYLMDGDVSSREFTIRRVDLFDDVVLLGMSAETVTEYGDTVRQLFPDKMVLGTGCLPNTFGYLPTQSMLASGGYEVDGFLEPFSLQATFRKDFETVVVEQLQQIANTQGEPVRASA